MGIPSGYSEDRDTSYNQTVGNSPVNTFNTEDDVFLGGNDGPANPYTGNVTETIDFAGVKNPDTRLAIAELYSGVANGVVKGLGDGIMTVLGLNTQPGGQQ